MQVRPAAFAVKRLVGLLAVLAAIVMTAVIPSAMGDNYNAHDATRAAKGAVPGAATILAAYRMFLRDQ